MGGCLSSIDSSSTRVSFIGLQGSGKSSLIAAASAKVVAVPTPVATPLPSVEPTLSISQTHCSIGADSSAVVLIDAPSDPSLNAQLSSDILVFVVDAADFQRYQSARAELDRILRTRGDRKCSLLIAVSKYDLLRSQTEVNQAAEAWSHSFGDLSEIEFQLCACTASNAAAWQKVFSEFLVSANAISMTSVSKAA